MTGLKKVFFSFFVLICLLFFISVILLRVILPSNVLKNFAQRKISSFTGGKSEVKSVSVGLSGIVLSDVKVFFTDDFEITVKKIIIAPNLFPFPRKQIAINRIKVVNPVVKFNLSFADKNFSSLVKLPVGYTLILNRVTVEDGEVYCPKGKFRISELNGDIKIAPINGFFTLEIFFNIHNSINVSIKADYNLAGKRLIIKEAIIKDGDESVLLTGYLKNFLSFKDMNFNINVNGSGMLFNRIFLSNLYKKKITVFEKDDIDLNIIGNPVNFQIKN